MPLFKYSRGSVLIDRNGLFPRIHTLEFRKLDTFELPGKNVKRTIQRIDVQNG